MNWKHKLLVYLLNAILIVVGSYTALWLVLNILQLALHAMGKTVGLDGVRE